MAGLIFSLKRLFGLDNNKPIAQDFSSDRNLVKSKVVEQDHAEEISLDGVDYISLPPSPPYWELRQEQDADFYSAYDNPAMKKILEAYWNKQYQKVVNLIDTIQLFDANPKIEHTILKAYRKLIQRWRNQDDIKRALKWSAELLERMSTVATDYDRKRHNKMIEKLNSLGVKHSHIMSPLSDNLKKKEPMFEILGGNQWEISNCVKLAASDRPSIFFNDIFSTPDGTLYFDKSAKSTDQQGVQAVAQLKDRTGSTLFEHMFSHDIYRCSVNPIGGGVIVLSAECCLYAYNNKLKSIYTKDLKSVDTEKNHIRCVSLSSSCDRFIYTIADTAWCVDCGGKVIWNIKLPPKKGWEEIVDRVESYGTTAEIKQSLDLLGLSFPFVPEDVKNRYRKLALKWHPDKNPGDPLATERMQRLNNAYQQLTGIEIPSELAIQGNVTYKKVISSEKCMSEDGSAFTLEISISGNGIGMDWIYAVCYSEDGGAYIGSYSGRIIKIDNNGEPERIFDIGCVPNKIVEINSYLYVSSDTRLYVIKDCQLVQMIDIFQKGSLIFSETGFGLAADKAFSWYDLEGNLNGTVVAQHPIRLVSSTKDGLVITTRQYKTIVKGVPSWWNNMHGNAD